MNKKQLYESIMLNVAREVKKALNESSDLTAEDKMELWDSGERNLNVKACSIEKLINYLTICIEFGYDECANKLKAELLARGIDNPLEYEPSPISPKDKKILDTVNYAIRKEIEDIAKLNGCSIYEFFDDDFIEQIEEGETWALRLSDINGGDDFESMLYEALEAIGKEDNVDFYIKVCKKHNGEMTKIVNNILADIKNHTW